jgi:formylglycine-generating enzyme required for sulfatase activity
LLASTENGPDQHLRASLARLALWPGDRREADYLYDRLLGSSPAELPVIWGILRKHDPAIERRLWPLVDDAKADKEPRFRAACALANTDSAQTKNRWDSVSSFITDQFLTAAIKNPGDYATLIETLRPVRKALLTPLARVFRDDGRFESERTFATTILIDYAGDDPRLLADLLMDAGRKAFASLFPVAQQQAAGVLPVLQAEIAKSLASVNEEGSEEAKDQLAGHQARAAIALVRLGQGEEVWPLLRHGPDPRLRSFIIHWLNPLGADPHALANELAAIPSAARPASGQMDAVLFHPETSIRRALILALGTYAADTLSPGEREPLAAKLLDLYKNDPDAGIHGAAEWTLRHWGQQAKLAAADAGLMKSKERGDRRWFINGQGQTFVVIEGPVVFRMGSPPGEPGRDLDELPHRRLIPRFFAMSTKEASVAQYQKFLRDYPQFALDQNYLDRYSPGPDRPMIQSSWFISAAYCNWLSKQEGLPEEQWCYLPNKDRQYAGGMTVPADVLKRKGYRLPTEAEWEYACRAGALTSRYYGVSLKLLSNYAWYAADGQERAGPCGSKLPNDLGLFDMMGNVYEWCQNRYQRFEPDSNGEIVDKIDTLESIDVSMDRLLRGGAFSDLPADVRSAYRIKGAPSFRYIINGFRPARTYN